MLFLIVVGVISFVPGDEDEAGKLGVNEFPVTALPARHAQKARLLQVGNKLANLAGHMTERVTDTADLPAFRRVDSE